MSQIMEQMMQCAMKGLINLLIHGHVHCNSCHKVWKNLMKCAMKGLINLLIHLENLALNDNIDHICN